MNLVLERKTLRFRKQKPGWLIHRFVADPEGTPVIWYKVPGVPDWERQMTEWLNKTLVHEGPVGHGIRARQAS